MAPLLRCVEEAYASSDARQEQLQHTLDAAHQMEARLAQAARMASLGTVAAGVAHEVNNPLTYLAGNLSGAVAAVQELTADPAVSPRVATQVRLLQEQLADAQCGADRVAEIVRALQTFSRPETDAPRPTCVHTAVALAVKMAGAEVRKRATLCSEVGTASPRVLAHEGRLSQVVLNLLVNAAQAMLVDDPASNRVTVRCGQAGARVLVEVEDNGRGIADAHLPRLFEPFFTTKAPGVGTGLGLSICHRIVEGYGGTIRVRSKQGVGSTFCVELPALPADAQHPLAQASI